MSINFSFEQWVLIGALLVLGSILLGLLSSRVGAPLLLVFLGLGMLVGSGGLQIVLFDNYSVTYHVGSVALAIILFDGGLRTRPRSFELGLPPASLLATIGVFVTAGVVAVAAFFLFNFSPIAALLLGAIVAPTDAAAVFLLLHQRGAEIKERVNTALEVESGLNDPMAIFLTLVCIELLAPGAREPSWWIFLQFITEMIGGAVIGIAGGFFLLTLINRLEIAPGLYPILALAVSVAIFGGSQAVGASGFLAVYLAGLVLGRYRHRASGLIIRFFDGIAWLSQIGMFLLLGLLVEPMDLVRDLVAALGISLVLLFVARPLAVWICLVPLQFRQKEIAFVSWVGLRGAVPIFLASLPVLTQLPNAAAYFNTAFVVVLVSLLVQGWTVGSAARWFKMELPPHDFTGRHDIDTGENFDRDIAGYRVARNSPAALQAFASLRLPSRTRILSVIRDGVVLNRDRIDMLKVDDYVLCVSPPEQLHALDALFVSQGYSRAETGLGDFTHDGGMLASTAATLYQFSIFPEEEGLSLGKLVRRRLNRKPTVGDQIRMGSVDLVVRAVGKGEVAQVGIVLDPGMIGDGAARSIGQRIRALLARGIGKSSDSV